MGYALLLNLTYNRYNAVYLLVSVTTIVFTKHCSLSCVHVVDVSSYCVNFSIVGQIPIK